MEFTTATVTASDKEVTNSMAAINVNDSNNIKTENNGNGINDDSDDEEQQNEEGGIDKKKRKRKKKTKKKTNTNTNDTGIDTITYEMPKDVELIPPISRKVGGVTNYYMKYGQTNPPTVPIFELFPSNKYPQGEMLAHGASKYPLSNSTTRCTMEEKRYNQ